MPENRPQSVTVFGILNVIFGCTRILSSLAAALALGAGHVVRRGPMAGSLTVSHPVWYAFLAVISLILGVIVLIAGIGLLHLKPWARVLSIVWGAFAIARGIIALAMTYFVTLAPMVNQPDITYGGPATAKVGIVLIGMGGGLCLGVVYPVLLMIFMTRPNVVAAFRGPAAGVPQNPI